MCAAAIVEVLWLGFCFGTVIVGIILLFTVPGILFAPLLFLGCVGYSILAYGFGILNGAVQFPTEKKKETETTAMNDLLQEDRKRRLAELKKQLSEPSS